MFAAADNELAVTCLFDGDDGAFITTLVAAVNSYEVVAAATADADFNRCVVAHNQRTGAEAVGGNGG